MATTRIVVRKRIVSKYQSRSRKKLWTDSRYLFPDNSVESSPLIEDRLRQVRRSEVVEVAKEESLEEKIRRLEDQQRKKETHNSPVVAPVDPN